MSEIKRTTSSVLAVDVTCAVKSILGPHVAFERKLSCRCEKI